VLFVVHNREFEEITTLEIPLSFSLTFLHQGFWIEACSLPETGIFEIKFCTEVKWERWQWPSFCRW